MVVKGHEVEVNTRPECQLCHEKPAEYDGKTSVGPWAFMCQEDWDEFGPGRTGVGFGQRLVLRADAAYIEMVTAIGRGFHPDTRDYSSLPQGWTQERIDATINSAIEYGVDIYGVALDVINAQEA